MAHEDAVPALEDAVRLAVDAGLSAAAVLDAKGKVLAFAGSFEEDEARATAAHATQLFRGQDKLDRMIAGELMEAELGGRDVKIAIVSKVVFVVVVFPRDRAAVRLTAVDELRDDVAHALARAAIRSMPLPTSSGGSSSGPAELPVVELGVTMRRRDSN